MGKVIFSDVIKRANTKEDRFNTDKIYYVGGEHIETNELLIKNRGLIVGSTIGPMFYFGFKAGQVLFVTRNPHLRKAGMVNFDGICSEKTFVLESKDTSILLQKYLPLVMQTDIFWQYCEEHKSGGVNFFVNWSTLADYEFELPSIEEQRVLADKLWAAYNLKEAYKKMIAAIDEMVKSQFIEMFGTGCKRFSLESLSVEWLKGQPFKKDEIIADGVNMCIHYGELFTKYGAIINAVSSRANASIIKSSRVGDILFPASDVTPNGLARCSSVMFDNVILGGDIIIMRPQKGINPQYLSYAINAQKEQLLSRVTGSVVKHLSGKSLKSVTVPVPSLDMQDKYVDIAQQADKSKFELKEAIDKIDRVMKSLLQ